MNNVAIIITGDIRDCYAKDLLKKELKDFDIFIGSYIKHQEFLKNFGSKNKLHLINPNEIRIPKNISKDKYQQNMLQFLHLDNIIKNFYNELKQYNYIFKFRFDIIIKTKQSYKDFILESCNYIKNNILYNDSDKFFFSTTDTFLNLFHDFYDNTIFKTYDTIDKYDGSFENSWKAEIAFKKNTELKNIEYKRYDIIEIIRGNYNKEHADGNRKLYSDGILYGKFQ